VAVILADNPNFRVTAVGELGPNRSEHLIERQLVARLGATIPH
jgi:hypothetical protein